MTRKLAFLGLLLVLSAGALGAQGTRADLLRQASTAYEEFNAPRARELARAALDPSLGAPDSAWVRSVHLLAQVLVEANLTPLARNWARWAMRLNPTMPIDSVDFLAAVVTTLRQARDSAGVRSSGDEVTRTSWQWPARQTPDAPGRIRLDASRMPVPVNVLIRAFGALPQGPGIALPPGTYEIEVGATGYLPARVSREVLPGVTTGIAFELVPVAAIANALAEPVRQRVFANTVALTATRFGSPGACGAGAFAAGNLVLTSYTAIRGAESIAALSTGTSLGDGIRVAAYDASANLAVLVVPAARPDSLLPAATLVDGQALWGVGLAQCRTPGESRALLEEWSDRPAGALRLREALTGTVSGAPLVDHLGRFTGVAVSGTLAVPVRRALPLLETARRNVAARQTLTLADVARRESHLYGTLAITSDVAGAAARLTPLEAWHWTELATTGNAPFTFSGPVGRYRLEVTAPGVPVRAQEVIVRPGETVRVPLALRTVAAGGTGGPPAVVKKAGVPRWVWVVAGVGAAGAAAAMAGGGGPPGGTEPPTTGGIRIVIPANPP